MAKGNAHLPSRNAPDTPRSTAHRASNEIQPRPGEDAQKPDEKRSTQTVSTNSAFLVCCGEARFHADTFEAGPLGHCPTVTSLFLSLPALYAGPNGLAHKCCTDLSRTPKQIARTSPHRSETLRFSRVKLHGDRLVDPSVRTETVPFAPFMKRNLAMR